MQRDQVMKGCRETIERRGTEQCIQETIERMGTGQCIQGTTERMGTGQCRKELQKG